MVTVQVPQEREARPVDAATEMSLICEALIPKVKATEGKLIRILNSCMYDEESHCKKKRVVSNTPILSYNTSV
jgi:hypothetical protein